MDEERMNKIHQYVYKISNRGCCINLEYDGGILLQVFQKQDSENVQLFT